MWRIFTGPLTSSEVRKRVSREVDPDAKLGVQSGHGYKHCVCKHLSGKPDVVKGTGAAKRTYVSAASLEYQDDLLREVMLLHTGVDSFLTASRKGSPTPRRRCPPCGGKLEVTLVGVTADWVGSDQRVGQRRDVVTKSVSGVRAAVLPS